jgi:hypothetical protein
MPITNTDAVLWYNVGEFGKAGYAVPNWSNDVGSLNPQILDWTYLVGRNLFHIMHHEDADLRIPPSINTAKRIHKLYLRAANILAGRAVPPGENNMEVVHARPAGEVFRVFPVPFFLVRNQFMRRWAELILMSLAEAMQHTENRRSLEISTAFAGQVGQYVRRVYINMAIELFGKTRAEATADGFKLSDADFPPTTRATSSRKPKWSTPSRDSIASSPKTASTCWPKAFPSPSCRNFTRGRRTSPTCTRRCAATPQSAAARAQQMARARRPSSRRRRDRRQHCGLRISGRGMKTRFWNPQSEIRNPK